MGRWSTDDSATTLLCILHTVLQTHLIGFLPEYSNTYTLFPLAFAPWTVSLLLNSFPFFIPIFPAADKEVEDYYTRKRHLPDLAARGTLPLHVLKISQEQVGVQGLL